MGVARLGFIDWELEVIGFYLEFRIEFEYSDYFEDLRWGYILVIGAVDILDFFPVFTILLTQPFPVLLILPQELLLTLQVCTGVTLLLSYTTFTTPLSPYLHFSF